MHIKQNMKKSIEVKKLDICVKCSDRFYGCFYDAQGNLITEYEGYVPDFFPEDHCGDYVELSIDLKTGKILNWVTPTTAQLEAVINEGEEE